jgi:hypothetical protein
VLPNQQGLLLNQPHNYPSSSILGTTLFSPPVPKPYIWLHLLSLTRTTLQLQVPPTSSQPNPAPFFGQQGRCVTFLRLSGCMVCACSRDVPTGDKGGFTQGVHCEYIVGSEAICPQFTHWVFFWVLLKCTQPLDHKIIGKHFLIEFAMCPSI